MNQVKDWEKRARELLPLGLLTETSIRDAALQLGREMADETFGLAVKGVDAKMREAADARAEEIARSIEGERWAHGAIVVVGLDLAASIARSTITGASVCTCPPSAAAISPQEVGLHRPSCPLAPKTCKAPVRYYRWAHEGKGEDIHHGYWEPVNGTPGEAFGQPSKAREQVLEEALREIVDGQTWTISAATAVARRALEWKP